MKNAFNRKKNENVVILKNKNNILTEENDNLQKLLSEKDSEINYLRDQLKAQKYSLKYIPTESDSDYIILNILFSILIQ